MMIDTLIRMSMRTNHDMGLANKAHAQFRSVQETCRGEVRPERDLKITTQLIHFDIFADHKHPGSSRGSGIRTNIINNDERY